MASHHFCTKPPAATVPFFGLVSPLKTRVVGVFAIISACAQDCRGNDPGRDQWSRGGHPDYPLGFGAEIIDSGLPVCPGCLRVPLWLSTVFPDVSRVALVYTLTNVSRMTLQWFIPTKAGCILWCNFLNLYGHLNQLCHWFVILYCHPCYMTVSWCVFCLFVCLFVWTQVVNKLVLVAYDFSQFSVTRWNISSTEIDWNEL